MAILYFVVVIILILCNITALPAAIKTIVVAAFTPKAVTGGAVGSMLVAMQKGVARGIFSNEAGLGSAPIAAAAAQTNEPVRQGLVSMTGTFIDTIVICTLTGLSIVLTGAWKVPGLEGVQVTTYAFQKGLPFPNEFAAFVLMLCLVFFAFTTILGWDYYSERCLEYLSGGNMKHGEDLPIYLYPCDLHRTIYDCKSCLDDCRYLQWIDGIAKHDRIIRTERCCC